MTSTNIKKVSVFKKFPRTFWVANTIELFERWAWYGFFMLFANYLTGSLDTGGLQFSQAEKGLIMGIGTAILYFLPVLTGSIADKYGYKNILILAFIIYITAFIAMPAFKSFAGVFLIYLYLALGGALFKPIVSATVAKTTDEKTSSIGFGIFYMMVNIGGFFGPLVTLVYKDVPSLIFYISAGFISLNFILLFWYKEPLAETRAEKRILVFLKIISTLFTSIVLFLTVFAVFLIIWIIELPLFFLKHREKLALRWSKYVIKLPIGESNRIVFENITGIFFDTRFITFLVIVAGFWTMYLQLYFTLPVFISQWVDTSAVYNFFFKLIPFITNNYGLPDHQIDAEFITNLDAMFIIIFQIIVSTLVMKLKPLHSMAIGFLVSAIGISLSLLSQNILFTIVALLIFSLGEMAGSPKITEYIGRIAPADKKGVYMGYSFIPFFIGNIFAGLISGVVYQHMSDKTVFVKREAAGLALQINPEWSTNEAFNQLALKMKMQPAELTNYLWDKYNPSSFWMVLMAVGLLTVVSLIIYNRFAFSPSSKNN